jgi:hypothetical protein
MNESELAQRLARDLGPLAVDAVWSVDAADGQPQGSYSDGVADAKQAAGVVGDLSGVTDPAALALVRQLALRACLERLELHYATLVDTMTGGETTVTQRLSQVRQAIAQVRQSLAAAISAGAAPPASPTKATGLNLRGRRRPDYDVGSGNAEAEP